MTRLILLSLSLYLVPLPTYATPQFDRIAGTKAAEAGDYDQAFKLWKQAAEAGDSTAEFNLGVMFDEGLGRDVSISQAMYWYQRAASNGVAQADHNLGNIFQQGRGVSIDLLEAKRRYERAAKAGYAAAQYNLGQLLLRENPPQYEQAVPWFQKAADQNQVNAMLKIAQAYATGAGVKPNRELAINWYQKVRERTDAIQPQRELALMYMQDEQDYLKGQQLLRTAAEQGDAESQYQLGLLYGQGKGLRQDYEQAVFWYQRAAKQQHGKSQYLVCLSYSLGKGVLVDILRAHVWCEAALEKNIEGAAEALDALRSSMTEHELKTAEKLAPLLNPKK